MSCCSFLSSIILNFQIIITCTNVHHRENHRYLPIYGSWFGVDACHLLLSALLCQCDVRESDVDGHIVSLIPPKVECYDYDNDGSHDLIGIFETNMKRLQEATRTSPVRTPFKILSFLLSELLNVIIFYFCLSQRLCYVLQAEFDCINMKKKLKKKSYKNSGVVSVKLCQVWYRVSRPLLLLTPL